MCSLNLGRGAQRMAKSWFNRDIEIMAGSAEAERPAALKTIERTVDRAARCGVCRSVLALPKHAQRYSAPMLNERDLNVASTLSAMAENDGELM